jgi:hypothetical protein
VLVLNSPAFIKPTCSQNVAVVLSQRLQRPTSCLRMKPTEERSAPGSSNPAANFASL